MVPIFAVFLTVLLVNSPSFDGDFSVEGNDVDFKALDFKALGFIVFVFDIALGTTEDLFFIFLIGRVLPPALVAEIFPVKCSSILSRNNEITSRRASILSL